MAHSRSLKFISASVAALMLIGPMGLAADVLASKPAIGDRRSVPKVFRKSLPNGLEELKAMEGHIQGIVREVAPAVISVRVENNVGTAVIISTNGLVLCAAHVCGAPHRTVEFTFADGRIARGETLGTNHEMDSGLMRITDPGPWSAVTLANPDSPEVGDWVLALGHPGGFDVNRPVVARLGRVIALGELLRTDCTLISGDSGGPLFDMHGRVVGIHSRISKSTADNYHVPIGTFLETWERLVRGDNWGSKPAPQWSTIGVRGVDASQGCRLEYVRDNGPAATAGLQVGDVVTQVNTETITDAESFEHSIRQLSPGDEAVIRLSRQQTELILRVKAELKPNSPRRFRSPR